MRTTFLIGNGFDVGIGLKTKYEDFYKRYCVMNKDDKISILEFKQMLSERNKKDRIIDWSDFERAFGEYSTFFEIETKQDYLDCFIDFIDSFNAYIEEQETRVEFSEKTVVPTMTKAISSYYDIRQGEKRLVQEILDNDGTTRYYNFVTFNYTKVLDQCVTMLKKSINNSSIRVVDDVLHIHGYVEEGMIIGVNDQSQILNEELAKDPEIINALVKPQQNENIKSTNDESLSTLINNSDIVCVYGMSIGATDKKWWDLISKWLLKKETHILILLMYNNKYNKRFPYNITNYRQKTLSTFLSHSSLDEEQKNRITNRILIDFNKNIFSMSLVPKEEIQDPQYNEKVTHEDIEKLNKFYENLPKDEWSILAEKYGKQNDEFEIYKEMLADASPDANQEQELTEKLIKERDYRDFIFKMIEQNKNLNM